MGKKVGRGDEDSEGSKKIVIRRELDKRITPK